MHRQGMNGAVLHSTKHTMPVHSAQSREPPPHPRNTASFELHHHLDTRHRPELTSCTRASSMRPTSMRTAPPTCAAEPPTTATTCNPSAPTFTSFDNPMASSGPAVLWVRLLVADRRGYGHGRITHDGRHSPLHPSYKSHPRPTPQPIRLEQYQPPTATRRASTP